MSVIYNDLIMLDEAIAALKRALKARPDDITTMDNLARVLIRYQTPHATPTQLTIFLHRSERYDEAEVLVKKLEAMRRISVN